MSTSPDARSSTWAFHGWVVVAAAFATLFVVFGVAYSFSAFFVAFQTEFDASRGDVSLVFSISGFLYFSIGAVSGRLADRIGPRRVALAGIICLSVGLLAASFSSRLWQLYLTYGLGVGLGVGCAYVPSVGAIQPWFVRQRGLASGLAVSGIGVGTLVVPLIAVALLGVGDWRMAFRVLAAGALICGGIAAWRLDNQPARRGLRPDNAEPSQASAAAAGDLPTGHTVGEALRTRLFWLEYAGVVACSVGLFIPFVHLAPYALDHGHSGASGALLVGLIGVGSALGRFGLAGIADRFPRAAILACVYALMGLMFLLWMASTQMPGLAAFALLFGTFYGAFVALAPAMQMDFFGARHVSGIIGALYTGAGIGNLLGPLAAGIAFDLSASYTLPLATGAGLMFLASALALALPRLR